MKVWLVVAIIAAGVLTALDRNRIKVERDELVASRSALQRSLDDQIQGNRDLVKLNTWLLDRNELLEKLYSLTTLEGDTR